MQLLEQFEHSDEVDFPLYKENTKLLFEQLLRKLEENDSRIFDLEQRVQSLEAEVDVKDMELERANYDMQTMQEAVQECRSEADAMVENMLAKIAIEVNQRRAVERTMYKVVAENEKLKSMVEYSKLRSIISKFGYETNWESLCVSQQHQVILLL